MPNSYFSFKQFTVHQDRAAMKVTTDACLFGAWAADRISGLKGPQARLLDIGTGTGLLALMMAQRVPSVIDAIELDKDAFDQALENIAASPWKERIGVLQGDATTFEFSGNYNLIVSNPPFYENELASGRHQKNLAHHEAGLLLADLLGIIKRLLLPGGRFYLLLPFKRAEEIGILFQQAGLAALSQTLVRQSTRHGFFRIMIEGGHANEADAEPITGEMSIVDEANEYTPAFRQLLRHYYLRDW